MRLLRRFALRGGVLEESFFLPAASVEAAPCDSATRTGVFTASEPHGSGKMEWPVSFPPYFLFGGSIHPRWKSTVCE